MPYYSHTIRREDDVWITDVAYQVQEMQTPKNTHGVQMLVSEIVEEMRINLRSGLVYQIETSYNGRVTKCYVVDLTDMENEDDERNIPEKNGLLGDIDGWKDGRVYDPDGDPQE